MIMPYFGYIYLLTVTKCYIFKKRKYVLAQGFIPYTMLYLGGRTAKKLLNGTRNRF